MHEKYNFWALYWNVRSTASDRSIALYNVIQLYLNSMKYPNLSDQRPPFRSAPPRQSGIAAPINHHHYSSPSQIEKRRNPRQPSFPARKKSIDISMHPDLPSTIGSHDSDQEAVLVDAEDFSDDDDTFEDGISYDEDEFEDDEDDMSLTRIGLHDLNTLRHLYRFGLLSTRGSLPDFLLIIVPLRENITPSNDLNHKVSI